jgi:hypothetical protein
METTRKDKIIIRKYPNAFTIIFFNGYIEKKIDG